MGIAKDMTADNQTVWSDSGYVTEIPYMRDYMRYQSPVSMAFAVAANGKAFPDYAKPFKYCDLGCGEAVTTLTLAAAYPHGHFVGIDLNEQQIRNAQELATQAGLENVEFLACDFSDPKIQEYGPFEFIAAHGIYSWVAPSVQEDFHKLVDANLAPGGLLYFCHYVRPGSAKIEAVFQLLQSLMSGKNGSLQNRVQSALTDLKTLVDEGAPLFDYHSSIPKFIAELERRDPRYLVHEFCNQFFHPRYFPEVAQDFRKIGCHYAGSTRFERNGLDTQFGAGVPKSLEALDLEIAEERASLLTVDQFRWDVFRRNDGFDDERKEPQERMERFFLDATTFPYAFTKETTLWDKEVSLDPEILNCLANIFQSGTASIGTGLDDKSLHKFEKGKIHKTLLQMIGAGNLIPTMTAAQVPQPTSKVRLVFSHKFSAALSDRDLLTEGYATLPSLNCGSMVGLAGFDGMAALAHNGRTSIEAKAYLKVWLTQLDKRQAEKVKRHRFQSERGFDEAWSRFQRTVFPRLLKHQILTPILS